MSNVEEEVVAHNEEEDTGAQVAPIVRLEEVSVTTGEEDEEALLDLKAKLYRYDKDGNQWKERGGGTVKLLRHKTTGKVRLVMRQAKTLKICANHLVLPSMTVQEHAGNDKSCVWHAPDFADGEVKEELFCIRFPSVENCRTFMERFNEVAEAQQAQEVAEGQPTQEVAEAQPTQEETEDEDASSAAEVLAKLTVKETTEEVPKEKQTEQAETSATKEEQKIETKPTKSEDK
ncbi:unnamed protein product [Rhodiola kirilowii]